MDWKLLITGSVAYDSIETPLDKIERVPGGSAYYAAMAASFFSPPRMAGIVGTDFDDSDIERLKKRGINLDSLVRDASLPTFFWRGKYHDDFSSRETLEVQLNAFEHYSPALANSAENADVVLLGNISPKIQSTVLSETGGTPFVILDTMDLWINTANKPLRSLIKKADILLLNESEAKTLSGDRNIIAAGGHLLDMGAKSAIIKTGEYGAMLFHKDGFFTIPAFPVKDLRDPTGAGDSFAGALAGYITSKASYDFATIKRAMLAGAAAASLTVESFSCIKLEKSGMDEISRRANLIVKYSSI